MSGDGEKPILLLAEVVYGAGKIKTIDDKVRDRSVLLVSDKGVVGAGIVDGVRDMCRSSASVYEEFLEVPPRTDRG